MKCQGCGKDEAALCEACGDHSECADPDDVCDHFDAADPGTLVGEWFDRERLLGGMSPEVIAVFERCISDLEGR